MGEEEGRVRGRGQGVTDYPLRDDLKDKKLTSLRTEEGGGGRGTGTNRESNKHIIQKRQNADQFN